MGVLTCFIWPSLMYLAANSDHGRKNRKVKVFLVVGMIIFAVCTLLTFIEYQPTTADIDIADTISEKGNF